VVLEDLIRDLLGHDVELVRINRYRAGQDRSKPGVQCVFNVRGQEVRLTIPGVGEYEPVMFRKSENRVSERTNERPMAEQEDLERMYRELVETLGPFEDDSS
jgi:hypothetical protein